MKISQKVELGQIDHTYVSSWSSSNEVELHKGDNSVTFSMSEDCLVQFHKKLGDKLTNIAAERLEAAKELAQKESSDDE